MLTSIAVRLHLRCSDTDGPERLAEVEAHTCYEAIDTQAVLLMTKNELAPYHREQLLRFYPLQERSLHREKCMFSMYAP